MIVYFFALCAYFNPCIENQGYFFIWHPGQRFICQKRTQSSYTSKTEVQPKPREYSPERTQSNNTNKTKVQIKPSEYSPERTQINNTSKTKVQIKPSEYSPERTQSPKLNNQIRVQQGYPSNIKYKKGLAQNDFKGSDKNHLFLNIIGRNDPSRIKLYVWMFIAFGIIAFLSLIAGYIICRNERQPIFSEEQVENIGEDKPVIEYQNPLFKMRKNDSFEDDFKMIT